MEASAEVLDSGTGPGRGWLVAAAVAVVLGLGSQLPWSGGGTDVRAAGGRGPAAAAPVTPSAPPHWRGRIIVPEHMTAPIVSRHQTYPQACPRTADTAMRWLSEYAHGRGCR
jgi:hypothetical protein